MLRMIQQLPIKIEDVSVRVALAQNRDETKNQPSETVTFTIRFYQRFARYLAGAVERSLYWKGRILWCRYYRCFAVNGSARRESDRPDIVGPHSLKHMECS